MAIIRSIAVGKARKSMGNVTFRVVRGRTIGSEKIGSRPLTRATDVSLQQFVFGLVTRFMAMHAGDIMVSFNQSKYGSERNYFAKVNFAALRLALRPLYMAGATSVDEISDAQIEAAVATYAQANPQTIYRVKRSGYEVVYLEGEWSSDQNPEEINPALRVSFSALQKSSGAAYDGSISEAFIVGTNLDKVTSITARGNEEGSSEAAIPVSSFQLQADGRLKVLFNYETLDPLGSPKFVNLVLQARPQGSITWSGSGDDELDPLG